MASRHIESFFRKSWNEKFTTVQFFVRKNLAKVPFVPVPVRMRISDRQEIRFWWSYISPFSDPNRGIFDYWGHDLADLRFLWNHLEPGMVFLDIGAHHGIYSIVAAKRLGRNGTIVAFEPSLPEYRRLRLHIRMNQIRAVRAESTAIGATTSTRKFFRVVGGDSTRGGLQPPASHDRVAETSVESVRLDDFVSRFPLDRIDMVKLDVEGGELEVLQGASNVLTKLRPTFICEVLDAATQAWGYEARQIILKFKSFDFKWFEFRPDGSVVSHDVKDRYPDVRNYLAVPRERCPLG
jgi:FkbM family methyltransferase